MKEIKFKPQLTPKEMLELGVFGGYYFEGNHNEYPKEWFKNAKLSNNGYDIKLNYFKIDSGLSRKEWLKRGWVTKEDPLGWFQWYCRYFMGRRITEVDQKQTKCWRSFRRHAAQGRANCNQGD